MPFVISKVVSEVAVAAVVSTAPVTQYCEDTTPRFFGIKIGNEEVTCYDVIPSTRFNQNFPSAGRVTYETLYPSNYYNIPGRVGGIYNNGW